MTNRNHTLLVRWAALALLVGLVAACAPAAVPPEPTRVPAPTFTPTPLIAPAPVAPPPVAPPAEQPPAQQPPAEQPPAVQPPAEQPPAPEPTPTETPVLAAEVIINANMNVRGGPGTNYNIVGAASQGQRFPVTGRNNDSSWWQINFNGQAGWVFSQLVTAQNTQAVAIAANIPAPPPPPPPTATPLPPPPQEAPPPQAPPPPADNFPFMLLEGVERCDPNPGNTYFSGYVRRADNSLENGVCVHIAYYEPRVTKCSGCDGVGDGNWGFSPFGGPAPSGVPVEIFVVPCSGNMPLGGQTAATGFGDLSPQSKKWTRTITTSEQCTGITFVRR
jgi:hypothetical protein